MGYNVCTKGLVKVKEFADFYEKIGENIRKYRKNRDYSLEDVAKKIGITKKTLQRYETGETRIEMERLTEIAKALNIPTSLLLGGAEHFLDINVEESTIKLPVYSSIACGKPCMVSEDIVGYEVTPKSWLNGGEYFYIQAKGDSMIGARINDGDLLLVRKQPMVEDGEIAAVVINDECTMKRVFIRDGSLILQSENPKYAPIIIKKGDVRIIGKLKKVIIKL
ncbi:MAG: XRE family transcriptional regulator [Bacteroidia bacterium]|nr:XRE family transcriptional regulator [Bacteroidia bacterium]